MRSHTGHAAEAANPVRVFPPRFDHQINKAAMIMGNTIDMATIEPLIFKVCLSAEMGHNLLVRTVVVPQWRPKLLRLRQDVAAARVHHLVLALGLRCGRFANRPCSADFRLPVKEGASNNQQRSPPFKFQPQLEFSCRHFPANPDRANE